MRVYRALLRAYPPSFRRRHQCELEAFAESERLDPRYTGAIGTFRFWRHILGDLTCTAARQRLEQARSVLATGTPHSPAPPKRTEMETLLQDIRYALRSLARRPGFTFVAVLSLALGIGGTSLIYGLVDGFVLHPFPYPDPDRLVSVGVSFPKVSSDVTYVEALSPAEHQDVRSASSFAATAAFDLGNRNISDDNGAERVFTALVLDDPFPVIGMRPTLGRGFTRDELAPNGPRVAIISDRLWQSRFGADPNILNRSIRIGGESAAVVGVMPPGLVLIGADLWMPFGVDPAQIPRNIRQMTVLARLAPAASLTSANAELAGIAARVEHSEKAAFKEYDGWRLAATPWASAMLQDVRPAAFLLLGAVGLVLLIACVNLANLFLARSTTRARELAVRQALGAGRGRLVRHLLTETILLALVGGVLGLVVAYIGLRGAGALVPAQFRSLDLQAGINVRVLVWSLGLSIVAGILVGVLPALRATRSDPHESLRSDSRAGAARSASRARGMLVVAEIALSVVLLLGAGLLMRSFVNLNHVELGFQPHGVLTMRLTLPREQYAGAAAGQFFDRAMEQIAGVPGVTSVAVASQFPPAASFDTRFTLERAVEPAATLPSALITVASPSIFATLQIPLARGRGFEARDRLDAPRVAVVNQTFATRYLAGTDPIGQRLSIGDAAVERSWTTIVGVVADVRSAGLTRAIRPELYIPAAQQTAWNQLFILTRGSGAPEALVPGVRDAVRSLDAEQPLYSVRTMDDVVAQAGFQQRIAATLLSVFASVALVMAAVGIFGVMSYSVSARTQEMGVRLAIGAQRRDVVWLILGDVLVLAAIGLVLGVGVLLAGGRALSRLLFGVQPADALTIVCVTALLAGVALLAAWIPAARAGRIDPIDALRYE